MQTFSVGNTIFMMLVGFGMLGMLLWFGYDIIIQSSYRAGMLCAFVAVELSGVFIFKMNSFLTDKGITTANLHSDNFDLVAEHVWNILLEFSLAAFAIIWVAVLLYVFVFVPMDQQQKK